MNERQQETLFDLYVPASADNLGIDAASAIVAAVSQRDKERVLIYYEGGRFGGQEMKRYEVRALHAAGRASVAYPTIAKSSVERDRLIRVGSIDLASRRVTQIDEPALLQAWLGSEPVPSVYVTQEPKQ